MRKSVENFFNRFFGVDNKIEILCCEKYHSLIKILGKIVSLSRLRRFCANQVLFLIVLIPILFPPTKQYCLMLVDLQ
jgi:hypothetical protein